MSACVSSSNSGPAKEAGEPAAAQGTHGFFGRLTADIRDAAVELCAQVTGRILDVGCGNGLLFAALRNRPDRGLFGVDFSRELLREGRHVLREHDVQNVHLVVGDAFYLPFRDGYDRVLCLNTLYNLTSWAEVERVLGEMMRVCGPGGRAIFDIRNKAHPYIRLKYWWHRRKGSFFTYAYGRKEIRRLLERNGFAVRQEVPVGSTCCGVIPFAYVIEAERVSG